jgi:hypothetical protein
VTAFQVLKNLFPSLKFFNFGVKIKIVLTVSGSKSFGKEIRYFNNIKDIINGASIRAKFFPAQLQMSIEISTYSLGPKENGRY